MTKNQPRNADDSIATRASLLNRLKDHEDRASWQEFFEAYWSAGSRLMPPSRPDTRERAAQVSFPGDGSRLG